MQGLTYMINRMQKKIFIYTDQPREITTEFIIDIAKNEELTTDYTVKILPSESYPSV